MKRLLTLILIFITTPSWAENEFFNSFNIDVGNAHETADTISRYYLGQLPLDSNKAKIDLNNTEKNLNQLIQSSPKNPILYFIKGLNYSLLASYYKQAGDKKFKQSLKNKTSAYEKAIQLDNKKQTLLSASIYATMKYSLPEKYKIKAIQKELAQGGSGDNESQYWYLHWSNINSLQKAGRFKEAKQALKNMRQELADEGLSQSTYNKISEQAEYNLNQAIAQKRVQTNTSSKPHKKIKQSKIDTKTLIIVIITIASLLAFISISVYELKIKKRK